MATKKEVKQFVLPEGRVINESIWEKESYTSPNGAEGKAQYKIEMAFDPDTLNDIENALVDAAVGEWGASAEAEYDNGKIVSPLLDGNKLAERREAKGKPGDAYKGKIVIRANTSFNADGADAPGGIYVAGPDATKLNVTQRNQVYNGCYGVMIATIGTYIDNRGDKGLKFYLAAFQKTKDGDRLVPARDYSTVFKPVGRTASADGTPVRRRRG